MYSRFLPVAEKMIEPEFGEPLAKPVLAPGAAQQRLPCPPDLHPDTLAKHQAKFPVDLTSITTGFSGTAQVFQEFRIGKTLCAQVFESGNRERLRSKILAFETLHHLLNGRRRGNRSRQAAPKARFSHDRIEEHNLTLHRFVAGAHARFEHMSTRRDFTEK